MADGYELEMLSKRGIQVPRKPATIEVLKYKCKKDFFDIKEGMIVYAHYHPEKFGLMVIDSTKWRDQPINTGIWNKYFDYWDGIIPFFMFNSMKHKDREKYCKEVKEMRYYE